MYLLYLDESGNENDPSNRYFVLAGLALFERQIHHLNQRLERVQEKHFPTSNRFRSTPQRFELAENSGVASARKSAKRFWMT